MSRRRVERPLKRGGSPKREQRRRVLVYCEGSNTERIYLRGLSAELRGQPVTVVVGGTHGEPPSLVRAARKHMLRFAQDSAERFDAVWCVFDVEAPRPHAGLAAALREAADQGIDCAVSNPCFELWLLLHFRDQTAYLTTKQAQRALADVLPGYEPGGAKSFAYDDVRAARAGAVERAVKGHAAHPRADGHCAGNPCTTLPGLLAALRMQGAPASGAGA